MSIHGCFGVVARRTGQGVHVFPAVLLLAASPAIAHDEPIAIGRSQVAPFQLHVITHEQGECIDLLPGDGPFAGLWFADEPAFATLAAFDPGSGLLPLFASHRVALRRLSFDTGLVAFEPAGFSPILTADGATFEFPRLPDGQFDINLVGAADRPGIFSGVFQLTDLAGTHADSDPFTLCFQTVPAPPAGGAAVIVGLLALRRRR